LYWCYLLERTSSLAGALLNKSNHPALVIASESEASKAFIVIIKKIQIPGFHYLGSFTAAIKPGCFALARNDKY
jgi:hypothetical protein